MDHDPAGGRTALAGRAETSPYRAVHCEIQFGVIHDEDNVLPPHLEVMVLEIRRAFLGYGVPYRSRSRERYESDFLMTYERQTHVCAGPRNEIDDSRGEPCLFEHLDQVKR